VIEGTRSSRRRRSAANPTRVCLEIGSTWVFATALDWPGWCRRGRGEEQALEGLAGYEERYRIVAGEEFVPGPIEVVGRSRGNRTTDFGAPHVQGPWDVEPVSPGERERLVGLLEASWGYFDQVAATAPAALRKGPRGGGRDRDAIVDHVREAERAYSAKLGARVAPRTPWVQQRIVLADALRADSTDGAWPVRYAIRRCAWHVLDHAWEIEDKSEHGDP
jgi:hypothetical protein